MKKSIWHKIYKFVLGIGIFFISIYNVCAVNMKYIDSVENALKKSTDYKAQINNLYTLTFEYGLFNPRKGLQFGFRLLEKAKAAKDEKAVSYAYNGIANCYESMMMFDSSLYYNGLIYSQFQSSNKYNIIYPAVSNIAFCHKKLGHYNLSIEYHKKAIQLHKYLAEINPRTYYYLGEIYLKINNLKAAEEMLRTGLEICEKRAEQVQYFKAIFYSYLGVCYAQKNNRDSALQYLKLASKWLAEETDKLMEAQSYMFLADAFNKFTQYDSSLLYYNKSIQLYSSLKNKPMENYNTLKKLYTLCRLNKTQTNSYIRYELENTEHILPLYGANYDLLTDVYKILSDCYEQIGDYKKAIVYSHRGDSLMQTILDRENRLTILEFEKSYETLMREKKIQELKSSNKINLLELENKQQMIKRYIIIIIAVVLISAITIFFMWQNHKKKKELLRIQHELKIHELKQQERSRISKDLHDDIGSGLNKIYLLGEMIINNRAGNKDIAPLVEKIQNTSKNMILSMRDMIWMLNDENLEAESIVARIREYSYDYLEENNIVLQFESKIEKNIDINSIQKVRTIISISKEILNNILKHSKANKVNMLFEINATKFKMTVTDNGIGIGDSVIYGNGIKNMRQRCTDIGADFNLESKINFGTRIILSFDIN